MDDLRVLERLSLPDALLAIELRLTDLQWLTPLEGQKSWKIAEPRLIKFISVALERSGWPPERIEAFITRHEGKRWRQLLQYLPDAAIYALLMKLQEVDQ